MLRADVTRVAEALAASFPTAGPGALHHFESLGSTSDHAAELARTGAPEGTMVVAEAQTAGRGRRGSRWESPAGANLLFSLVLRPAISRSLWPRLTHLAGLAVADAIEDQTGLQVALKWPNDLYLSGRKTAGILLDAYPATAGRGFAIAGIGLNVNMEASDFPPDLRGSATALSVERGHPIDRAALAAAVIGRLGSRFARAGDPGAWSAALHELARRSLLRGRQITARLPDGKTVLGRVTGLGPEGELRLLDPSGTERTLTSADNVRPLAPF